MNTSQANDPVNHPAHYTSDPSGVECITITRHRNNNIGAAIKYLWRAGLKDNAPVTQDLRKAIWYIEDEINRLEVMTKQPDIQLPTTKKSSCSICGMTIVSVTNLFKLDERIVCRRCADLHHFNDKPKYPQP